MQKKLIQSIENLLEPKFGKAKGYLIGSHAYNIAKGGLATVDFHLDLSKLPKKCVFHYDHRLWLRHQLLFHENDLSIFLYICRKQFP